jgi:hypothetical protein
VALFGLVCATLVVLGYGFVGSAVGGDRADDPARAGGFRASADDLDADAKVPEDAQGELQGGISAVTNLAMLFGTVFFAWIFGHFMAEGRAWQSPDVAFWIAAGCCGDDRAIPDAVTRVREDMSERFTGSFTQQEPIPEAGIEAAMAVLRHGRLHRYNTVPGRSGGDGAAGRGVRGLCRGEVLPCAGLGWGGDGLRVAGAAGGAGRSGAVECLHAGPGAGGDCQPIGARPVFVEVTEDLTIDLAHLEVQAKASGAKVLLLSHMRGHVCDMDRLLARCATGWGCG